MATACVRFFAPNFFRTWLIRESTVSGDTNSVPAILRKSMPWLSRKITASSFVLSSERGCSIWRARCLSWRACSMRGW
jgi:hypothetical protein